MKSTKFIAFDFGAESGRAIVGILADGLITVEEIHRFPNRQIEIDGHLHWDVHALFGELKKGLALAAEHGHGDLVSIGIDTWGVDYGLIGSDGKLLRLPFSYRDRRTDGMMEKVLARIPRGELYRSTGIQFMQINTLYQIAAEFEADPSLAHKSPTILFMPDIFNYFSSGKISSEYTIASTSQMLNAGTHDWERTILQALGIPDALLPRLVQPGTVLGPILPGLVRETGLKNADVSVVAVGSHDTASAVAAVPAETDNWAYLSSGTWSIIGIESAHPVITEESQANDFTNEGGIGGTIRLLRNGTGMWLLQECRKAWEKSGRRFPYNELMRMASAVRGPASLLNPSDPSFLHPADMPGAIAEYCIKTGQCIPANPEETTRSILESLAMSARFELEKIGAITHRTIGMLHIVGGGSQNTLLNQLTADAAGIPVVAGPVEATALGNIIVQAMSRGLIASVQEGRSLIARSFNPQKYMPVKCEWRDESYRKFLSIQ